MTGISQIDGCIGKTEKKKRVINKQSLNSSILCFGDTLSSLETNILLSLTHESLGSAFLRNCIFVLFIKQLNVTKFLPVLKINILLMPVSWSLRTGPGRSCYLLWQSRLLL